MPFRTVKHGQIVVGLGQFWEVFSQRLEGDDRVVGFAQLGLCQAANKTPDGVFRLRVQVDVHAIQCNLRLTGLQQTIYFLQVGRLRRSSAAKNEQRRSEHDWP